MYPAWLGPESPARARTARTTAGSSTREPAARYRPPVPGVPCAPGAASARSLATGPPRRAPASAALISCGSARETIRAQSYGRPTEHALRTTMNASTHSLPQRRFLFCAGLCAGILLGLNLSSCSSPDGQQAGRGTGGHPGTGGAGTGGGAPGSGGAGTGGGAMGGGAAGGTGNSGGAGRAGTGGGAPGSGGAGGKGTGGGAGSAAPGPGTPCSNNQDCGSAFALMCRAPGEFLGCGACQRGTSSCASDTDCAPDGGTSSKLICDPAPSTSCFCQVTRICLTGCRGKGDCPSGQDCNSAHQCQNTCVAGDGTCPVDFSCGTDGFCRRTPCTSDADCAVACVKGRCYSTRGACDYTPI